jgi:REP element-mobilizing transposase RayT
MNEHQNSNDPADEVLKSRRRLPHWEYLDSIYFITWRLHKKQSSLKPEERTFIVEVLKSFDEKRYTLFSYVIMDDHIHVLVRLHPDESLPKLLHTWKSYSANRLQKFFERKGSVWQEEYFDTIVREGQFYPYLKYISNNPKKRWGVEEYPWVWCKKEILDYP